MFGHGETKSTCLWLKNLPLLEPTNIAVGRSGSDGDCGMTLSNETARCDGYYAEGWREGCEECLRRIAPRPDPCLMIDPPLIIVFECEYLIEAKK